MHGGEIFLARVNVYLPEELVALVRAALPGVNVSAVLQAGLRDLLDCPHPAAACAECGASIDLDERIDAALGAFYLDCLWELADLARRSGTAEGAARIVKSVALRHRIAVAERAPLPGMSRAERRAARARELPEIPPSPAPALALGTANFR